MRERRQVSASFERCFVQTHFASLEILERSGLDTSGASGVSRNRGGNLAFLPLPLVGQCLCALLTRLRICRREVSAGEAFHVRRIGRAKCCDDHAAKKCLGVEVTGYTQDTNGRGAFGRMNLGHMTSGAVQANGWQTTQVPHFFREKPIGQRKSESGISPR